MRVFSGNCCMCDVGLPTGKTDMHGKELFTGDVVQLWVGHFVGTEFEEFYPNSGLTVVTADQYETTATSNLDEQFTHKMINEDAEPFTMGIQSHGVCSDKFKVVLVKNHKDLVSGEKFESFGINFK